jgi:hypothetical protein
MMPSIMVAGNEKGECALHAVVMLYCLTLLIEASLVVVMP